MKTIFRVCRLIAAMTGCLILCLNSFGQPFSPPSISATSDQGIFPNSTNRPIKFIVGDAETPATLLTLTGVSSNTNLIPNSGIIFGGSGSNRTATLVPAINQTGTATITITVSDANGGFASDSFALDVKYFSVLTNGFALVGEASTVWGDYDDDGLLDALIVGGGEAHLYHNNGSNIFVEVNVGLTNGTRGIAAWVDYNRDGRLDIVLTADTPHIYRNDGNGIFTFVNPGLPIIHAGGAFGAMAWGDFDNDGDLDVALSGQSTNLERIAVIYRNDGNDTFTDIHAGLPGNYGGTLDWGDFDNDGDLDLLISGRSIGDLHIAKIYRNDNGTFVEVPAGLTGVWFGTARWGDFDNDGDLDILLTGSVGDYNPQAKIYRNNNGIFTDIAANLSPVWFGESRWVDFDSDGYLDALLTGRTTNNATITRLYRNNRNQTFSEVDAGLANIQDGTLAWGDIDNDGDLDLFLMGFGCDWGCTALQLGRNNASSNSPPSVPINLSVGYLPNNETRFRWNPATDAPTPSAGLSYNLRIGTTPGGTEIVSPEADPISGRRRVAEPGSIRTNLWRLRDAPKGTYYWAVQAIDSTLASSAFSTEQIFTVTNTAPSIDVVQEVRVGPSAPASIAVTVTDSESPSTQLSLTAVSANGTFIPQSSVLVQGTSAQRTVSFTVGAGQFGTNLLVLRATDPGGRYREVQVRVVSELFTVTAIPSSTNFLNLVGLQIGWGNPHPSPVVDVDQDGDFDVLMQGTYLSNNWLISSFVIASNDGSGNFTFVIVSNITLPAGADNYTLDDFNHDGIVDLLTGGSSYDASSTIQMLAGNGVGGFLPAQNIGTGYATMFSDIDGDGDLDALAFTSGQGWYRNDGGLLRLRPASGLPLGNYMEPITARATDLDHDGDVDFFMPGPGTNSAAGFLVTAFKNNGRAQFTPQTSSIFFPEPSTLYMGRTYDGNDDNNVDIGFSYQTNYAGPIVLALAASDGTGHFYFTTTNIAPGLTGNDFDNDGDIDRWVGEFIHLDPYTEHQRLYLKTGPGQYAPQSLSLSETGFEGDFDGDGDLDYIAPTELWDEFGQTISPKQWRFFRNNSDHTNLPPSVPTGLTATQRNDDRVTFAWNASVDDHTPTNFVTYNLRIGTTPGGIEVLAPCANPVTGRRWLSAAGNAGPLKFHDLRSLPPGTYYWSVQAIDGVFAASAWAAEKSITINPPSISALPDIITPPGIASKPISFSVTGGASPVSSLNITVVADDPTLVPTGGLAISGTGAQRTLTITPGNSSGDTELTVTATDTAGFSAVRRCHVRVAWWDPQQSIPQLGIQRYEEWHWADLDLDGRLDLFGYMPVGTSARLLFSYRNLGGTQFASNSCNLPLSLDFPVQVAGFGGDNLPDVFTRQVPSYNTASFRIWKGSGASFQFTPLSETLNQSFVINPLWVDLDNDGWRDVVHFGSVNSSPYGLFIAHGNPDGTFTYLPQRIGMTSGTSIAIGDFDSDGDFDLAVSGTDGGTNFTRLYLNVDHGDFVPNTAGLPQGSYLLSVADVDGDSRPDLLLNPSDTGSTNRPHLMHNVGGSFVEVASDLATELNQVTWADFDNDGDLDLLGITSVDLAIGADQYRAALFRNDGGVLTRTDTGLPSIVAHGAEFADADNDGDLDLLISGETGWNMTSRYLCLNTSPKTNTPPPTPTNSSSAPGNASMLLQWTPVPDAESGTALTYNLRLGTSPGGSQIVAPVADTATGRRRLTGPGNIGSTPRRRLLLPDGTYYWSVQAVDAGFAASPFTAEGSFTCYHPTISTLTNVRLYPGASTAVQSFTVGDTDSAATSLTLSASSSNPAVLPPANIIFDGAGSSRMISVQAVPKMVGTSVVSVVVTDVTGLTATNSFIFEAAYFTEIATGLPGGNNFAAAFADYDNDGDLDFYLGGIIYRNNGGGNFTSVATLTATAQRNGVAWGDFDRDGDLDLAVVGATQTIIYRNDGGNVFTDINAGIPAAGNAAIAWGDYDNDGDLDLISLAADVNGFSRIYRNYGEAGFVPVNANVPAAGESGVAWGDYDNDGNLDLLLNGFRGPSTTVAGIFHNNGDGTFSDIGAAIPGFHGGAVAWGDYDNDGFLDAAVAGVWSTFQLHIYHNNQNGTFTETNVGMPGAAYGSVQWVDFDNDGDLDLLLCGNTSNFPNLDYATYLFRNNGDGSFTDTQAGLPKASIAAWGNIDSDSDLDLLLSGDGGATYRFFRNECNVSNSPPTSPTGLTATLLPDNNVMLSWSPAGDLENTNPASLNYALRAGLVPGGANLLSPHAQPTNGFRRLPARGPFNATSYLIRDVPRGTYYWSAQAIDAAWMGSAFAVEKSFTITNARPVISVISNQMTVPNRAVGPLVFTVSDFETPAVSLVVTAASWNTTLLPLANIALGGAGTNRTVTVTPETNQSGTATIVLALTDAGGLVATSRFDLVVQSFSDATIGLPAVATRGASAWADYDNDSGLDIALSGSGVSFTTIYRNTSGMFTNQNFNLPNRFLADLAWVDLDRDGDLDLLESGWESTSGFLATNYFFRNNFAVNSFTTLGFAGVTNIADGTMAWGDYDNDGDLDLYLSGDPNNYQTTDAYGALYRNDRGVLTNSGIALPSVVRGAAVWGDFDNDGDLDLLIAGQLGSVATNSITKLFRNDGNSVFTEISTALPAVTDCALAFGDFNNDGKLDILIAGLGTNSVALTRIYKNMGGGVFTNFGANLLGVSLASVAWGDFDNDGFLDALVSGSTNGTTSSGLTTKVYRNNGGTTFTDLGGNLPGIAAHTSSWGDFDNDSDLDLLIGSRVYRNNWNISNTPPSAPTNLASVILALNEVQLSWSPSTDLETTNARGLSYNLRIGTNSGGGQIMSPASAANGYHRVPNFGNAGPTNFWRIANLTNGTYYWSVQAIDSALAGSVFATEGSFTLSRPNISAITNRSVPPNTVVGPIAFTVSDAETIASNLVVTATSSDTNLVAAGGLVLGGADANRTLTITPLTNRSGVVTITVTALDESGQAFSRNFQIVFERFADIAAGLTGNSGAVAWGDFDNDGNLDLIRGTTIYHNNGDGTFTDIAAGLPTSTAAWASWGDYDNDGWLDLVISGTGFTQVLRNSGGNTFTSIMGILPGNADSEFAWGDFDNDGDLDFLQAYSNATYVFRNNGTNNFTSLSVGLPIVNPGSVVWGDYDKDGDLDILIAGGNLLRIYRNNGNGTFTDLGANLPGIYNATVAWGDFDNDGDLDFVVAGSTNNNVNGVATRIYQNTGNASPTLTFTNLYPNKALGPVGIWKGAVAWGDYDNDGDLDLLVTGETLINNAVPFTKIYRNDNGNFVDSGLTLPALKNSFAAWGDYDNDGSLDLALSGNDAGSVFVSRIYRNFSNGITNVRPMAPANLTNVVYRKSVRLSWGASGDANQTAGLSYNLRVGTTPGAADIVSPQAGTTGLRKIAAIGNANERQSWTITNLTNGTFYWSVQAVDHSFAGSVFAAERSFVITNLPPIAVTKSLTTIEDTSVGVTLTGSDPDRDPVTFAVVSQPLFGTLSGASPNLNYTPMTNYFGFDQFTYRANDGTTDSAPASVFITVTPQQDVGVSSLGIAAAANGQYQLTLPTEPWQSYRIEASTDLVHWTSITNFFGTNLLTQLMDADARNFPQRFYRAALFTFVPAIDSAPQWISNQFQFYVTGETARAYQLQASTNLIDWSPIGILVMTNAPSPFIDRDVQNFPQRFYRVLAP